MCVLAALCTQVAFAERVNLNHDWCFFKGEVSGAQQVGFDDSGWRQLSVPHDWSIEDLSPGQGPVDPCAVSAHNTGYTVGGTAWYRKYVTLDESDAGRRVHLHFDGVYMNADVWVNGVHLGSHPYGYTAFWYDATPHVRFGETNVVAVEVKNEGVNSRWYSGSGIYRSVWLEIVDPVHIEHWGPFVTTSEASIASSQVRVQTQVLNESYNPLAVTLRSLILAPDGTTVAETRTQADIAQGASHSFDQNLTLSPSSLWSPEAPVLYTLSQEVGAEGKVLDRRQTSFGIRTLEFDAEHGFRLNGREVLLRGTCMHHDNYMLGAAAYPRAEERRVEIVKAAGFNAIRCAHNPPSTAFVEACDRLGMLVIDEAFDQWSRRKNRQDYHLYFDEWWRRDLESMVLRDRNHPSVIMWSIGNEIPEQRSEQGAELAAQLTVHIRSLDGTRPVTVGANLSGPPGDAFLTRVDVVGYNYQLDHYAADHARNPNRIMYGSESFPRDAFDYWAPVEAQPHVIGDFVWTGFDYLGEASIGWFGYKQGWSGTGPYPWHVAYCGDIDACGFKRPAAFYREVLWRTGRNQVSAFVKSPEPSLPDFDPNNILLWTYPDIHPSWTWPGREGETLKVVVYCAGEEAELFLNGASLGTQPTGRDNKYTVTWQIPYASGELKAVGYRDGRAESEWVLKTAGPPARIHLSADRTEIAADGLDLSYVTVEVLDAQGVRVPTAENLIRFAVQGPSVLAGVGNGRPCGTESFQRPQRAAFEGRCLAVLKSTRQPGEITLIATADGLNSDSVVVRTK